MNATRYRSPSGGPWREFMTLAILDSIQAGGTGKDIEIARISLDVTPEVN